MGLDVDENCQMDSYNRSKPELHQKCFLSKGCNKYIKNMFLQGKISRHSPIRFFLLVWKYTTKKTIKKTLSFPSLHKNPILLKVSQNLRTRFSGVNGNFLVFKVTDSLQSRKSSNWWKNFMESHLRITDVFKN